MADAPSPTDTCGGDAFTPGAGDTTMVSNRGAMTSIVSDAVLPVSGVSLIVTEFGQGPAATPWTSTEIVHIALARRVGSFQLMLESPALAVVVLAGLQER